MLNKLFGRLNSQSRSGKGSQLLVDVLIAKRVLNSYPEAMGAERNEYAAIARPAYRVYQILRLDRPVPYPLKSLFLELLPTYLLLSPKLIQKEFLEDESLGGALKLISSVLGIPLPTSADTQATTASTSTSTSIATASTATVSDEALVGTYKTIDGETLLSLSVQMENASSFEDLISRFPSSLGVFDDDGSSVLQQLLSLPDPTTLIRTLATVAEGLSESKLGGMTRLVAHDIIFNDCKGVTLLAREKYDCRPIFEKLGEEYIKVFLDSTGASEETRSEIGAKVKDLVSGKLYDSLYSH
jgi:hypothetical protein